MRLQKWESVQRGNCNKHVAKKVKIANISTF